MSTDNARYALEIFAERLEGNLEDEEGASRHQREQWEYQLKTAKSGLAELESYRNTVLSEVREKFAKHADDLRRQGEDDAAEIVNDLHDWIYEMETK